MALLLIYNYYFNLELKILTNRDKYFFHLMKNLADPLLLKDLMVCLSNPKLKHRKLKKIKKMKYKIKRMIRKMKNIGTG